MIESTGGTETYCGIGILPPPEIGEAIDRYRARFDGLFYERTVPHITVKQTFRLLGDHEALMARVQAACRDTPPFSVGIVGVADFGHGGVFAVYLHVLHTEELMGFQKRLVRGLADVAGHSPMFTLDYELTHYLPHVTLGQQLTERRRDEIRVELAAEAYHPAYCFPVHYVSVARRDPDMVWRRPFRTALGTGEVSLEPHPELPPWTRKAPGACV